MTLPTFPAHHARAALCAVSLMLGCAGDPPPRADSADSEGRERGDAGVRRDDGGATKDGGRVVSSGGGNKVGDDPQRAPDHDLVAVSIDGCGSGNAAGIDAQKVSALKKGGNAQGMRYLYPYDGTIFPRGLAAPLLMWEGGAGQTVYVSIRSEFFTYDGCLKAAADGRVQLPADVWEKAGEQTLGARTPFEVSISTLDGSTVRGPLTQKLIIARAHIQGSIFYNSYNSGGLGAVTDAISNPGTIGVGGLPALPGAGGGGAIALGGSISRIRPGSDQPETFLRTGVCTGCHSVSANGERMVAREIASVNEGSIYQLTPTTRANPSPSRAGMGTAFVGLSPDGKVYLSTAGMVGLGPSTMGALGSVPSLSLLYETDTGRVIDDSGVPQNAMMPTFSPDGAWLTFSDFGRAPGSTRIALMKFDNQGRRASDLRVLFEAPSGQYAGWPFLLPDNKAVIFTLGESPAFSGGGAGIIPIIGGPRTNLMIKDVETGNAIMLAKAMGFDTVEDAAANRTYLPFGERELNQAYYPTVSPVASGGYFWVFFDSVRNYGNLGFRRQLWGTAVRIRSGDETDDGRYTSDPSAPAFYVSGQQLQTANHRAFTALDPCRGDGESCDTGIDCCSGFCTDGVCGPAQECAAVGDACKTTDDCCQEGVQCIAGFCGVTVI